MKRKKEPIYELLEELYFVEGLEELVMIKSLKRKYLKEWCDTKGKKIKEIMFALLLYEDPEYILEILRKEELKKL